MDFNSIIEKISKKLSHKNLIIIIAVLLVAIIAVLAISFRNSSNLNNSPSSANPSTAKPPLVIIDPGHGGKEPGAGNGKINEKDVTLAISLEVEKVLKDKNINYYMIRNDDTYVSLEDRVKTANEKQGSIFISIHNNSFTDPSQSGILTTYNPNSAIGKEIAEIMQSRTGSVGMRDRGIMPRPNLYVLRHTEMPSLLLEVGFISNKKDLKLLTDSGFQQKCAQQIVLGIQDILSRETGLRQITGEAGSSSAN